MNWLPALGDFSVNIHGDLTKEKSSSEKTSLLLKFDIIKTKQASGFFSMTTIIYDFAIY